MSDGRRSVLAMCLLPLAAAFGSEGDVVDTRNIRHGREIPSEGYCDQPYVVITDDGAWLCTLTTGPGEEGNERQHVAAARSLDQGRTWTPLIDIEPHGPPESSWVIPLKTPGGRVYAFYVFNAENQREVIASTEYARRRVDTLGHYVFRYSDDGGRTWSPERRRVPIRTFAIDRENPYGGSVQFFWGVGKPIVHDGAVYIGLSKVGSFGTGFIERSEGFFLRSGNILTEIDPARIEWTTLPDGETGLRAPRGPIAEEHNLAGLSDGSLYCTYRTVDGHPCHAYSRDRGHTWTPPAYMTYAPGGPLVKHPRAANFVRRFSNGKYLYWFHNHGGTGYEGRNPAWLCGGIEQGGHIHWSQPEIALYDPDPKTRISYPDFIEQNGRVFITETQKTVARVHEVDSRLLDALWNGDKHTRVAEKDLALAVDGAACASGAAIEMARLPLLKPGSGFAIEIAFETAAAEISDIVLLDARGDAGRGSAVRLTREGALRLTHNNGHNEQAWESDPGLVKKGRHHHAVVNVDGGPRVLTFIVDGRLCDGGDARPQGWYRLEPGLDDWNGSTTLRLSSDPGVHISVVRIYQRYLLTAEAVGNYRAGRRALND